MLKRFQTVHAFLGQLLVTSFVLCIVVLSSHRVRATEPSLLWIATGEGEKDTYAETLQHDRVAPYITLSTGPSCNLDHYLARGGVQEFSPLTPKGGRYLEIQVLANPEQIVFLQETYLERCYHGPAEGSFHSGDPLLDRIWLTGVETLYPAAVKNMASFQQFVSDDGLADAAGWAFIDWGYVRNEGPSDMAFNLHYLSSLRSQFSYRRTPPCRGQLTSG